MIATCSEEGSARPHIPFASEFLGSRHKAGNGERGCAGRFEYGAYGLTAVSFSPASLQAPPTMGLQRTDAWPGRAAV